MEERYEYAKDYIGKLKDKIDYLKPKKEPKDHIKDSDEVSKLKNENEILKHELKITN